MERDEFIATVMLFGLAEENLSELRADVEIMDKIVKVTPEEYYLEKTPGGDFDKLRLPARLHMVRKVVLYLKAEELYAKIQTEGVTITNG